MAATYDRTVEDLGNIVALEHVNITVPDQDLATLFYVTGLGLTRDPYMMVSVSNMWVNIGRSQFHLPTSKPQLIRGHVGIVIQSRAALLERLTRLRKRLGETRFDFCEMEGYVEAVCPWGNHFRCYEPREQFGRTTLGLAYVQFDVPPNSARGIAGFYSAYMGAPVQLGRDGRSTAVSVGANQSLLFSETDAPLGPYDGHHIQIYVANFSGPYQALQRRSLISEESDQHQYRFKDIVDLETGKCLYQLEHEVRSMRHPLFMRPLVNRDPEQNIMNYSPGRDAWISTMPRANGAH
ncbi:MAG TPA: VOC family protein [Candidatus Binataceae bacterium]|nr:VOC family protein [Candidatus Binataceae bacterium]